MHTDGLQLPEKLEEICNQVKMCRVCTTFKEDVVRIEISVRAGSLADRVWEEAKFIMKKRGASMQLGMAPKGVRERRLRPGRRQGQ